MEAAVDEMQSGPSTSQAGPLPTKRGEIGFNEERDGSIDAARASSSSPVNLPARHPADRDHAPDATGNGTSAVVSSSSPAGDPTRDPSINGTPSETPSLARKRHLLKFLHDKKIPTYVGFRLTTLVAFAVQTALVCGTIAAWIITIRRVQGQGDTGGMMASSSSIFIHVVFAIAGLGQLIFLERRLFMLRGQRYAHKHPGQILPSSRYRALSHEDPIVAWSPWNRPPLPTYAAALAQSGVGTGDVEDHLIAQPPPPAYGYTRGSTMILQGFLRESLRAQRPASIHSQASVNFEVQKQAEDAERPLSYRSTDSGDRKSVV